MMNFENCGISAIMVRKVLGDISPQEQETLERWLAASEHNRAVYDRFLSAEGRTERERLLSDMNDEDFINGVNIKLRRRGIRKLVTRSAAAAAVIAAVVYIGFGDGWKEDSDNIHTQQHVVFSLDDGSSFELNDDTADSEWQQVLTTKIETVDSGQEPKIVNVKVDVPHGTNYKIRLDDGTTVWLNAETRIEYPNIFTGAERNVYVRGEAYFEVEHNAAQPFVVTTADGVGIRVLGTKFNVNCYDDASCTSVTLEEGSVHVGYGGDGGGAELTVDQQAVIGRADHKIHVYKVDGSAYSAWRNGMFDFRSAPLDEILSAMSRWYGIDFVLGNVDTADIGLLTLNVERGGDFSHVEKIIERITGLDFRVKGNEVYVSQ